MIKIVVVAFNGALASAITGIFDIFAMAGASWNRIQNKDVQRLFEVRIATDDGESIQCINGIRLQADCSFDQIDQADILIVPTIGASILDVLSSNAKLIQFLKKQYEKQCLIAGNCTGNFFLAEAGLLDHKQATTHWGFQHIFRERYPQVKLNVDQLITYDLQIYCAGGGLAWFDLGMHLIERFYGFEIAIQTAKSFVIDYRRDSQLSYSLMKIGQPHHDELVQKVQDWLEQNFAKEIVLDDLAELFNVTKRTLIRRFNSALDVPPNQYLQAIRIEVARKRLEETDHALNLIMQDVGYSDPSSFRCLFHKKTGLTPLEYRRRFSRRF